MTLYSLANLMKNKMITTFTLLKEFKRNSQVDDGLLMKEHKM